MYGLPKDVNVEFLVRQTLTQVCVGLHDLVLNFHGDVSITIMSRVCFTCSRGGTAREHKELRDVVANLTSILNSTVAAAKGNCDGTLDLEFETGEALSIYDDSEKYESYVIRHGGSVIVV